MTTTASRYAIQIPQLTVPNDPASTVNTSVDHGTSDDNSHSNTVILAIVVGVLSAISSITFCILLYTTSRCRRSTSNSSQNQRQGGAEITAAAYRPPAGRGGLDPAIVEHLPRFSFKSLKGNTGGLECAVCLSQYEESDILRLLPSCQHAFHVHCIDKWLVGQNTCPLCRYEISSKDSLVLVESLMAARRSVEDQISNDVYGELSSGAVPRRSLQMHSVRASTDTTPHVDIVLSSPRPSQKDESVKISVSVDGAGGGTSHQNKAAPAMSDIAPTTAAGRVSSSRNRRSDHRIVISDMVLQHRWSDIIAPADVLYLSSDTLFSPDPLNTASSNICLSFSSDGKHRWSTSSATRLSAASGRNNEALTASEKQQHYSDPRGGRTSSSGNIQDHNVISDPSESGAVCSNVRYQDAKPSGSEVEYFSSNTCPGGNLMKSGSEVSLQRSLSENTGLDRISGCISQSGMSQELFSSGSMLIGHPAAGAGNGEEEKIKKWLRIAGGTLRRLIVRDINRSSRARLDHQSQLEPY